MEVKRDLIRVCSSLDVIPKKNGTFRLILDHRFLNKHLAKCKFKLEDVLQPEYFSRNSYPIMLIFFEIESIWSFL